jgi:transcriptional regulator with XRE-family HTH domain
MTLGEKIKQIRNNKGLSQPELAERVGIEQSYLSKLENDKSMPSNDIFRRLMTAFEITVSDFVSQFEESYIRTTLCQITDVENHYAQEQSKYLLKSRKILVMSSLLIVLATTLFYTGVTALLFSDEIYQYESKGIIREGEPIDIFEGGLRTMTPDRDEYRVKEEELRKRHNPHRISIRTNKGDEFTTSVDGGRRTYYGKDTVTVNRLENAILQILGILFFSSGIMGFIFEFRMSRYKK